ncbi:MAG: hypothetical protein IEMM0002_1448 [bacterium]|nr:MAG: hypothetical protein IEMM0002_1448 [bacterium]
MTRKLVLAMIFLNCCFVSSSYAASFDFSLWDGILRDHVYRGKKDGVALNLVDYDKVKSAPGFKKLLDDLANIKPDFSGRREKIVFWINAYNIFALKMVVDNPGIESIRDAGFFSGSVWKRKAGIVGGKEYTLGQIEHEILRKLGEPRIHFAIVCASVSCPDLRMEAFDAARFDKQLDDQSRIFVYNRHKGLRIDRANKKIHLSKIFKWFKDDFEKSGGVRAFASRYMSKDDADAVTNRKYSIRYLGYNWKLNAF